MRGKIMLSVLSILLISCSEPQPVAAADTTAQCGKDTDCKGDRVCDVGVCTNSNQKMIASPTTAPSIVEKSSDSQPLGTTPRTNTSVDQCKSVDYDQLAMKVGLGETMNRYQIDAIGQLCSGDVKGLQGQVDNGFITVAEINKLSKYLFERHPQPKLTLKPRSKDGMSYGDSRAKFEEMGLCSSCADNAAQFYSKKPSSSCGKLAAKALQGNADAIEALREFPDYCTWSY